jgi:hypothetical protein
VHPDDAAFREFVAAGVIRPVDVRGPPTVLGDPSADVAGYYLDEAAFAAHRDRQQNVSPRQAVAVLLTLAVVLVLSVVVVFALRR